MSNKTKAITKTNVKIIINMDIAIEALNAGQIANLHEIIERLTKHDEKREAKR